MPDNFRIDVACAPLDKCLDLAFQGAAGGKATHWRIDAGWTAQRPEPPRLILAWHEDQGFTPLPVPMDADGVLPFVRAWLDAATYSPQPDHDGDNSKSWRVYNEAWGHVADCHYAFVAVEPLWAMHGK